MGQIAQGVIGAVSENKRQKRAEQLGTKMQIADAMSKDMNLTGNHIIDTRLTEEWQEYIKGPGTAIMYDKKGKITGVDKIALETKFKEFERLASFMKNNFMADVDNATKMQGQKQNRGLYDYDNDEIGLIYENIQSGDIDIWDMPAHYDKVYGDKYDSGIKFVNVKPIDASVTFESVLNEFKKEENLLGKKSFTSDKGGNRYTNTTSTYGYGSVDDFIKFGKAKSADPEEGAQIKKGILQSLTPEEKDNAFKMYPNKEPLEAYTDYFWDEKVKGIANKKLQPREVKSTDVAPSPKSTTGSDDKLIKKTPDGWDIRGNPKSIKGTIKTAYTDKGKKISVTDRNAYITEIKYGKMPGTNKEGLYASVLVPKQGKINEEILRRRAEGNPMSSAEIVAAYSSESEKSQEVYVPYNDIKNTLKDYTFDGIDKYSEGNVKEVVRVTNDGRRAIFNADTKEFLRYE